MSAPAFSRRERTSGAFDGSLLVHDVVGLTAFQYGPDDADDGPTTPVVGHLAVPRNAGRRQHVEGSPSRSPAWGILRKHVQSRSSEFTGVERVDVEQLPRLGRQRRLDGDEIPTGERFSEIDRGGGVVGHVLVVKERVAGERVHTEGGGTLADRATVTVDGEIPEAVRLDGETATAVDIDLDAGERQPTATSSRREEWIY